MTVRESYRMEAMNPKPATQSKTIWGAVAMLIAFLLQQFDVAADAAEIETVIGQAVEAIQILLGVGGFIMAVVGRFRAAQPIQKTLG
jgi:hypothetical protein